MDGVGHNKTNTKENPDSKNLVLSILENIILFVSTYEQELFESCEENVVL